MSTAYLLSQNYRYHMREPDYHMGIRSSALPCQFCSFLMIHLQASLTFSSSPIHSWRSQVCLHHSYCRDSFLPLKCRLGQIKCWMEQWRGLTWHDSYEHGHMSWRKTASTNAAQAHLQQGEMAGGNLIRARGSNTSRKQRGKQLLFSLLLLALVMFILLGPDISQKGVTTSETNSNSGYFLHLFSVSAEFIFHRKTQDCQGLAGSYIKEPKIALVLHRQLGLLLKAEANPTQVLLFSLHSRTDLPQNFTGLQLRNQAESSSSFFFIPEPEHTYPWYIKKEEMP